VTLSPPGVLDPGFETYAAAGAISVEMECSALFIVGTLRRVRTGAIVAIDGDARAAAARPSLGKPWS